MKEDRFQQYKDVLLAPLACPARDYYVVDPKICPVSTQIVRLTWTSGYLGGHAWSSYQFVADIPVHGHIGGREVILNAIEKLYEFLSYDENPNGVDIGIYAWNQWNSVDPPLRFLISDLDEFEESIISAKIIKRIHYRDWHDPTPDIPIKIYRGETNN